jgi:hypothetical protein
MNQADHYRIVLLTTRIVLEPGLSNEQLPGMTTKLVDQCS